MAAIPSATWGKESSICSAPGDDTSGRQWERTRRMGVNTLAFRLPQNGTFYTVDADLVGITAAVPWELNQQWLDVLARSGMATIVSPGPPARGPEQRAALRDAFRMAATGGMTARPMDWMDEQHAGTLAGDAGNSSGAIAGAEPKARRPS